MNCATLLRGKGYTFSVLIIEPIHLYFQQNDYTYRLVASLVQRRVFDSQSVLMDLSTLVGGATERNRLVNHLTPEMAPCTQIEPYRTISLKIGGFV